MKLLHTSDWHLGAMDGTRSLLEDQRFFIDAICDTAAKEHIDAVLIAGDVFDKSVSSAEAVRLYDYAMTKLCLEQKTPVLLIAGNHDSAERLSSCGDLLSKAGLFVAGALECRPYKVPFADTDVYLLPWITEEKVRSVFPEKREEIRSLTDAYNTVTDVIRTDFDPNKKHIIVSHAFVTGSETSQSDRTAEMSASVGTAAQIPADVFRAFDYAALGHIHKPQNVRENIRYSGTPMPYSFGREEEQQKSVTLIDTGDMSVSTVPLPLLHRRTTFTGTLNELLTQSCAEEYRNGYVRLQVTDCYVGAEAYSALKAVYPNCLLAAGKTYEGTDTSIALTMEELEALETDPAEVFKHFCLDETGEAPTEHLLALFQKAMEETEA